MKSHRVRSYSDPHFPVFELDISLYRSISLYSVQMWQNADQNNSEYGLLLHSVNVEKHYYNPSHLFHRSHCVKSVFIRSYSGSHFLRIQSE